MVDFSDIALDPEFAETITVTRKTYTLVKGTAVVTNSTIIMLATVRPKLTNLSVPTPQGDMVEGSITIYTTQVLHSSKRSQLPDEVLWRGEIWVVSDFNDDGNYGFYKSIAKRKVPN